MNPYTTPAQNGDDERNGRWPLACGKCQAEISFTRFTLRLRRHLTCKNCGTRIKAEFPKPVKWLQILIMLASVLWGGGGIAALDYFETDTIDRLIFFFYDKWQMPWNHSVSLTMTIAGLVLVTPLIGMLILYFYLERNYGTLRLQGDS